MSRFFFIATCALVFGSCASSVTEVVLVIDGDFETPTEVDNIEVEVTSPDEVVQTAFAEFDDVQPGFPRSRGIVRTSNLDEPYEVEIVARKSGLVVVRRKARFVFSEGRRRMLRISLLEECVGVICAGDTTCGVGRFCERPDQTTEPFDADALMSDADGGL